MDIKDPKEAGKFIAENSKDVKINTEKINSLAMKLLDCIKTNKYNKKSWKEDHVLTPKTMDKKAIDWIFLVDTLNFSFWCDDDNKCIISYKGQDYTGYWSLCAAVDRALDEGIPITDPNYYKDITREKLEHILRSDTGKNMPLIDERINNLHEAGSVLVDKFKGSFVECIEQCGQSSSKLVEIILENFPSYRDVFEFQGRKVSILKRAQILIGDIWACCEGEGYGMFTDIDTLTMFADYRLPQVLAYFGVMEYSDSLWEDLKKNKMFLSGERLEVEIRGCSIHAVQLLSKELERLVKEDETLENRTMNSVEIDFYLWDYRVEHAKDLSSIPFHRIRCIYY